MLGEVRQCSGPGIPSRLMVVVDNSRQMLIINPIMVGFSGTFLSATKEEMVSCIEESLTTGRRSG